MNFSFAIHGTPGKSECWGISNDETYLKSFYDEANNASEQTRLDIDYRIVDNIVCSYYHYLKLKNISNGIARSGGYFGMSIRFEGAYCIDIGNLFKMMHQLYEQVICKSILRSNGTNTEFVFSNFKQCQLELENIKSLASKALVQFNNDMREFPQNYNPKHSDSIKRYNLSDTGSESFRNTLLKDAEVYVSTEYPLLSSKMTFLEKDNSEKTVQIKEQQTTILHKNSEISALNNTIEDQNQTIHAQEEKLREHTSEIIQRNQKIKSLENELELANQSIGLLNNRIFELEKKLKDALRNDDMQEINTCILSLKRILDAKQSAISTIKNIQSSNKELGKEISIAKNQVLSIQQDFKTLKASKASLMDEKNGKNNKDNTSNTVSRKRSRWLVPASLLSLAALLFLLLYVLFGYNSSDREIVQPDKTEFANFKKETDDRLKQIETKLAILANTNITNLSLNSNVSDYDASSSRNVITRINLKGYSAVECGKEYVLEAYSGGTMKDCGGSFSCSNNATILQNDGSSCKIKVNSVGSDSILLVSYSGNNITKTRTIRVVK